MTCEAYQETVAAHVDGRLNPTEQQAVEEHVRSCLRCQRLFTEESRFRTAFSALHLVVPVPAEVEQRLRRALAAEREPTLLWWERLRAFTPQPRLVVGFAAVGLLLVLLFPRLFPVFTGRDEFTLAIEQYQAATAGQISFTYQMEDPQALAASLNHAGQLDFVTHVLDLRAAGYRLKGGQIVNINGHPTALVLYEGADGPPIVCLRQRGMAPPMPANSKEMKDDHLYTRAEYTMSLAQLPDHFCTLISRMPREAFKRRLEIIPTA